MEMITYEHDFSACYSNSIRTSSTSASYPEVVSESGIGYGMGQTAVQGSTYRVYGALGQAVNTMESVLGEFGTLEHIGSIVYARKGDDQWIFTIIPDGLKLLQLSTLNNQVENDLQQEADVTYAIVNINEQFDAVRKFFAFNKTEWSDIFGVSRVTIYGWLKHEMEPFRENAEKIAVLYRLVSKVPGFKNGAKISRGYLIQPIESIGCSVLELCKGSLNKLHNAEDISGIFNALAQKSKHNEERLGKLKEERVGRPEKDWVLDYNLKHFSH